MNSPVNRGFLFLTIVFFGLQAAGCVHRTHSAVKTESEATLKVRKVIEGGIETAKTIWGSSTRALEEARKDALRKTYETNFTECFDAVLTIADDADYLVFIKDRNKRHLVVMGIPGNVDTTEVGIFFAELEGLKTEVEITSLSTTAKEKVAAVVFENLDKKFKPAG